ncbi:VOC family protein [Ciceribacter ferrooxidans]|uniref:Glyoxalase n=1 Tax=Ciceribacter ferrooxidans TaxID=2509717 RepID=A0A4Q2TJZ8_9HYPH|nr:VOC family protein [Ciceribacter ferrooxidans]RYC17885.1 glyoxalase [Ciceribacter ferrooxidans]
MTTAALALAETLASTGQPERLRYGAVEFAVTDLDRSVAFWTRTLGFKVRAEINDVVELGTEAETLVAFRNGAKHPASPGHSGLYHIAIGVPGQAEFSHLLAHLVALRLPIAPVDHLMSKAIYFDDPDGLGIEIAYETPERFGRFGDFERGFALYDAEGRPHSGRERLDLEQELAHLDGRLVDRRIADGTTIAHIHLRVPDLAAPITFFEQLGFARNLVLPHLGFADLGAGAAYTHRLAMNTWQGRGLTPAPADMARLLAYELVVTDAALFETLASHPEAAVGGRHIAFCDPTGAEVRLRRA